MNPSYCARVIGQFVIHELDDRFLRDVIGAIENPQRDRAAEQRIDQAPAEFGGEAERDDHADIEGQIARIVERVAADEQRAGAADDRALVDSSSVTFGTLCSVRPLGTFGSAADWIKQPKT